ncbi:aminoglycoside phosphotransferase family protein [Sphaerisporangium fuscum]|uniref:aminoglycoside phosphotransferase family protein n=1 Tax=Sphaerisporangium fuscum TaxID=2835868 RepID=UPI001BDDBB28|nr:aminoglycoside phosphotransferase family protein [Sphaerisporangium fuscum]
MTEEIPLAGGFVSPVVRVDDTVRRPAPARAAYVRDLLKLFERHGWPGAPRWLGLDDRGRETLSFLDGFVAWRRPWPAAVRSRESLVRMAELVREFHDLTAGTPPAEGHEVVCHNDLSPKNTVYRDPGSGLRPVAFIDWDLAAPVARIHDVAHVCWQYLDLGPSVDDAREAALGVRLICDAYALSDRDEVVETILWWQDRCRRGIESGAADGDPAMIGLRDLGAAQAVRSAYQWVTDHRSTLEAALR